MRHLGTNEDAALVKPACEKVYVMCSNLAMRIQGYSQGHWPSPDLTFQMSV